MCRLCSVSQNNHLKKPLSGQDSLKPVCTPLRMLNPQAQLQLSQDTSDSQRPVQTTMQSTFDRVSSWQCTDVPPPSTVEQSARTASGSDDSSPMSDDANPSRTNLRSPGVLSTQELLHTASSLTEERTRSKNVYRPRSELTGMLASEGNRYVKPQKPQFYLCPKGSCQNFLADCGEWVSDSVEQTQHKRVASPAPKHTSSLRSVYDGNDRSYAIPIFHRPLTQPIFEMSCCRDSPVIMGTPPRPPPPFLGWNLRSIGSRM